MAFLVDDVVALVVDYDDPIGWQPEGAVVHNLDEHLGVVVEAVDATVLVLDLRRQEHLRFSSLDVHDLHVNDSIQVGTGLYHHLAVRPCHERRIRQIQSLKLLEIEYVVLTHPRRVLTEERGA